MDNFELQQILDTFEIIVDTREQPTKRALKRYESFGVPYSRHVLNYGDYTYNVTFPTGKLHDVSKRISGICCVERKQNLDELAMCFTRERARFEREFQRAGDNNAKMFLLVENASWELLLDGQYRSKFKPKAFLSSITAWQARYNLSVIFCDMKNSGILIKELLYRDLKERLTRGEFEWERNQTEDGLKSTDRCLELPFGEIQN